MPKPADVIEVALQGACIRAAANLYQNDPVPRAEAIMETAKDLYFRATMQPWKRGDDATGM